MPGFRDSAYGWREFGGDGLGQVMGGCYLVPMWTLDLLEEAVGPLDG